MDASFIRKNKVCEAFSFDATHQWIVLVFLVIRFTVFILLLAFMECQSGQPPIIMDLHIMDHRNGIMDLSTSFMEIHKSFIDLHNWMMHLHNKTYLCTSNWFMDLQEWIIDLHDWFIDLHNSIYGHP